MLDLVPPADDAPAATPAPERIPHLSDPEIDALPFGVMQLTHTGIILRYNLAEARFARLDRASVLGRNFFEEIAPCTRTQETATSTITAISFRSED